LYAFEKDDVKLLERVARLPALSESWREYFVSQLEKPGSRELS
jgi:hypothetical protein